LLEDQADFIEEVFAKLPDTVLNFRYAAEKWSVKEVLGHLIDCERVFGYRAFCISRGEEQPLPGFDENQYIKSGVYDERTVESMVIEFLSVRDSNLEMFETLPVETLDIAGTASGKRITVRALMFVIAAHFEHHLTVLQERYGVEV
jgi:hypothetical protein